MPLEIIDRRMVFTDRHGLAPRSEITAAGDEELRPGQPVYWDSRSNCVTGRPPEDRRPLPIGVVLEVRRHTPVDPVSFIGGSEMIYQHRPAYYEVRIQTLPAGEPSRHPRPPRPWPERLELGSEPVYDREVQADNEARLGPSDDPLENA